MSKDYMKEARGILGADLNQSIHHMIGYWYATSPSETFNTELASAMIEVALKEMRNPVGIEAKEVENLKDLIRELEKNKEMIKGE